MKVNKLGSFDDDDVFRGKLTDDAKSALINMSTDKEIAPGLTIMMSCDQEYNNEGVLQKCPPQTLPYRIDMPYSAWQAQASEPVILLLRDFSERGSTPDRRFPELPDGTYHALCLFQRQLFHITTTYIDNTTYDETCLLVKRSVYMDAIRLRKLRKEVETLEGTSR